MIVFKNEITAVLQRGVKGKKAVEAISKVLQDGCDWGMFICPINGGFLVAATSDGGPCFWTVPEPEYSPEQTLDPFQISALNTVEDILEYYGCWTSDVSKMSPFVGARDEKNVYGLAESGAVLEKYKYQAHHKCKEEK